MAETTRFGFMVEVYMIYDKCPYGLFTDHLSYPKCSAYNLEQGFFCSCLCLFEIIILAIEEKGVLF